MHLLIRVQYSGLTNIFSGEMYDASIAEFEWPHGSYWKKNPKAT